MAGGNFAAGIPMVFGVLIITSLVAFIESEDSPGSDDVGCDSNGNTTTCGGSSPQGFLDTFFDVSVTGIEDAPDWLNGFYILFMAGVLVSGLALIVIGIVGSVLGGG